MKFAACVPIAGSSPEVFIGFPPNVIDAMFSFFVKVRDISVVEIINYNNKVYRSIGNIYFGLNGIDHLY